MTAHGSSLLDAPLLLPRRRSRLLLILLFSLLCLLAFTSWKLTGEKEKPRRRGEAIEARREVVAADDGRCSEVGEGLMRIGGSAVDAAVATALCEGVVHPMSSGIGGGAFAVVRSGDGSEVVAFDSREIAPFAASTNMYAKNPSSKRKGALSTGVPGEIAGLHAMWSKFGVLPWKALFQPAIRLARDGFKIVPCVERAIQSSKHDILSDPGLQELFAPNGKLLATGDTCYNPMLAKTLEILSDEGPMAFYNGSLGEAFVSDVRSAGGVITMEDMRKYQVEVTPAMEGHVIGGYTLLGMPLPSSGTLGMTMILNMLGSYGTVDALKGPLGAHHIAEAMKHMFAIRMNLGDPDFVNATNYVSEMLSTSFAKKLKGKILDNTTFDPEYYMAEWSQLEDHGTSHFSIIDSNRNAVAMTSTINAFFGAGVLSPSTGIVLNDEMDDFSMPTDISPDEPPPAPSNFIEPRKKPLSSMAPIIILKDKQLAGVIGASGGTCIIPGIVQVFINHFLLGMDPLDAVRRPRIYHKLIPNVLRYENLTTAYGEHIEVPKEYRTFLERRGHKLQTEGPCSICQLVVQSLNDPVQQNGGSNRKFGGADKNVFHGMLSAVSDPRKEGFPAGM